MGLREKVALFIMVVFLVQLMYVECVPRPKKLKTSYGVSHKPRRSKLKTHGKAIQKSIKRDDNVVRRFNFPEVEYSLPMPQSSPLFSKQHFDLQCGQVPHSPQSVTKSDKRMPNESKNRKLKVNDKITRDDTMSTKISKIPSYPETETLPNTLCSNYKDFFPSVDYPLDASDLWTQHHWNLIPQIQPELKFNVKDLSINTKATEEISKYPKGPENDAAVTKTLNSVIKSKKTYKGKKKSLSNSNVKNVKQQTLNNKISVNHDSVNETGPVVVIENDIKTNMNDLNNPLSNSNKLGCGEIINNSGLMTLTTPPISTTPIYDHEPVTTSKPNFISPLTTLSPALTAVDEDVSYGKDTVSNPPVKDTDENEVMPDDMGYTLMYPEVYSYLSTSTTPPLLADNVDMWMYPELDNHTLNTYSDEVDQCYILVP